MKRPRVLIAAAGETAELEELFGERGFEVVMATDLEGIRTFVAEAGPDAASAVAVIDLGMSWGARALAALAPAVHRPVLIALVDDARELGAVDHVTDAAFARPVDAAVLCARAEELLSERSGASGGAPQTVEPIELSGGHVDGSELFLRIVEELDAIVTPDNARAILEKLLDGCGSGPYRITWAEATLLVESGQLATALEAFATPDMVAVVVERIHAFLAP